MENKSVQSYVITFNEQENIYTLKMVLGSGIVMFSKSTNIKELYKKISGEMNRKMNGHTIGKLN